MRKILFFLFVLLVSCSQPSTTSTEKEAEKIIACENYEDGSSYEIKFVKDTSGNVEQTGIAYSYSFADGRKVGFAISKQTSKNGSIYKAIIMAQRTTSAFSSDFWNSYEINIGNTNVYLSQPISTPMAENSNYQFLITGGLSASAIERLTNATLIYVDLINSTNPQVNTRIVIPGRFQLALLEYL
jgi:hypothetical protein